MTIKRIEKIISAVMKVRQIGRKELLASDDRDANFARKLLVHSAVALGMKYKEIASECGFTYGFVAKAHISAQCLLEREDKRTLLYLNAVRKRLKLSAYVRVKKKPKKIEGYKPFVKWKPEEEIEMAQACLDATAFMKNYGKGRTIRDIEADFFRRRYLR